MMSTNKIKCPNCGTSIDIDEILSHQAEEKYKKENVTYFLYLARVYKNLNKASQQITKLKFKELYLQLKAQRRYLILI